ncbi:MAG TPA: trypsin-like peptidase domain-containing protein [Patescibacteria group bacterium]|nr:trypsin-like peptidase domain-containing protein [Patescibacteria group bacterium]
MDESKKSVTQTLFVIGLAISAILGSVAGSLTTFFLTSQLGSFALFDSSPSTLSPEAVESRIVELIEEESATIAVVERVTPAVVSIVVKKERGELQNGSSSFFGGGYYFTEPLDDASAAQLVEISSGTGFFVTEDGYLLTNRHVVDEEGASFFVVTNDGEELPATLVDVDPLQDIAILRVEGDAFATVTLGDSDALRIGQTVIAIGNTLSEFRNTVTKGVVSGINRRVTAGDSYNAEVIDQAIQTDAAINPGNSGGPLINLLGEVIGINTAVSFQGESVAFAIPINEAKRAVEDVQTYGRIVRPWLGVRYVLVTPEAGSPLSREGGGSEVEDTYEVGALIVSGDQPGDVGVFAGSPADAAGLQEDDIIIAVEVEELSEEQALAELLSDYRPGDVVTLSVVRGTEQFDVEVTLAEYGE